MTTQDDQIKSKALILRYNVVNKIGYIQFLLHDRLYIFLARVILDNGYSLNSKSTILFISLSPKGMAKMPKTITLY